MRDLVINRVFAGVYNTFLKAQLEDGSIETSRNT